MTPINALASILQKAQGLPCENGLLDVGEEVVIIRIELDNLYKRIGELQRALDKHTLPDMESDAKAGLPIDAPTTENN